MSQTPVEIDDGRMRAHAARVEIEQPQTLHGSRATERHILRVKREAGRAGRGEGTGLELAKEAESVAEARDAGRE